VPLIAKNRRDKLIKPFLSRTIERAMLAERPGIAGRLATEAAVRALYRDYLPAIEQADYVVFQAEGTLAADFYMGLRLLLLPYYARVLLKKPIYSLNQTIFAGSPRFERVLQSVLSKFDLLAVREPASLDYARSIGLSDCQFIPDAAFNTVASRENPLLHPEGLRPQQYVCFSGSAVIDSVSPERYRQLILDTAAKSDGDIVLLGSAAEDRRFFDGLPGTLPNGRRIVAAPLDLTYQQVAAVLRDARLLVSGRFHMAVLAATVATPLVLLPTNTFKNDGLLAMLKYPLPVRRFSDVEQIERDIEYVLHRREELSALLLVAKTAISQLAADGQQLIRTTIDRIQC